MFGYHFIGTTLCKIQEPKGMSNEHYHMLIEVNKVPMEKYPEMYLAVSVRPVFGEWSADFFVSILESARKVKYKKALTIINIFFLNLGKYRTNLKSQ